MYFFGLDHFLALGQARSGFRSIRVWAVYYYGSKATAMSTHCIGRIGLDHVFFHAGRVRCLCSGLPTSQISKTPVGECTMPLWIHNILPEKGPHINRSWR